MPNLAREENDMTRLLALAALAVGLTAAAQDKGDAKAELEKFTGTWQGVSVVRDGKAIPKSEAEAVRLVVMGEKYSLTEGGEMI